MRYDRYVLFERYVRFEVCVLSPRYQSYLLQSVAALLSGAYALCHLADEIDNCFFARINLDFKIQELRTNGQTDSSRCRDPVGSKNQILEYPRSG